MVVKDTRDGTPLRIVIHMSPHTDHIFVASTGEQPDEDAHASSLEDMKAFHHSRNKTGVLGASQWHDDIVVHELWEQLSVSEGNGTGWMRLTAP